ncbi:hypothetical protein [Leptospira langatensis]|uniref:hypothetical protein n=1 Tax=Leptospira langatensis TaxID=2484983 RepID=UPI0014382998|nr:hypothetical protein [Leptospira langatensis]
MDRAQFQISADSGKTELTLLERSDAKESKSLVFKISENEMRNLEFKVLVPGRSNVVVTKLILRKIEP